MSSTVELRAVNGELVLAGTLHLPDGEAQATVLMVPGSGPSNRDNDGYFPTIRACLLARGIAAASFDKRGVGESAGSWCDTDAAQQTSDVLSQLACLRSIPSVQSDRLGLFGHSQGGWVVLEVAAADPSVAFVITSSGAGVTMASQERFATKANMTAGGASPAEVCEAVAAQDAIFALVRAGADFEAVTAAAGGDGQGPGTAAELDLIRRLLDYDPRPALERLLCPLLAIFGDRDLLVPVEESAAIFRTARSDRAGDVDIAILQGADHRLQTGEPAALHPDYDATLGEWIIRQASRD